MRKLIFVFAILLLPAFLLAGNDYKKNFVQGNPEIASMNAITFGPDGILFVGDSKNAMVYAIDTKDTEAGEAPDKLSVKQLDKMIAEKLGTEAEKVFVQDMAVNPVSKKIYLAIHSEDGTPVLMRLTGEELEWIPTDDVSYSKKAIESVLAPDAKDRRGRDLRVWTVSDLHYMEGQIMVSGLSDKEFSSTFRSMKFPFQDGSTDASLEIFHAAHGRYETYAPIKSFTAAEVNGQTQLIAGYTCTPLVLFPMEDLKAGEHLKGRTVAELGNWNTPVDMIVMEKEDEKYLLIANTNRAVMKIKFSDIESFEGNLTERIKERGGTEGVDFIALPWVNVLQLDKLDQDRFVMLKREANGDLNLVTQGSRWL
ncbi:MAG: hypothetical protein AAFY71_13090 [Bacteroidota bacterium]